MDINHVETNRHGGDDGTTFWFEIDGESFGINETEGFDASPLDGDGCPIDAGPDRPLVLDNCIVTAAMRNET